MPGDVSPSPAIFFSVTTSRKLSACNAGDIVWFVGGYVIAGNHRSFGRRARVRAVDVKQKGLWIVPDDEPQEAQLVSVLMTAEDIRKTLAACDSEAQRKAALARLQLQPTDLQRFDAKLGAGADAGAGPAPSPALSRMTKPQLIALVRQLQGQLVSAQSGKARKTDQRG